MRFAIKKANSKAISFVYKDGDNTAIKEVLKEEQRNFCAYSERYLRKTDLGHIEHFDNRLKNTSGDNYYNYYFVLAWANTSKPKIDNFLPIIKPEQAFAKNENETDRIFYDKATNKYEPINQNDVEAQNLIDFVDLNHQDLFEDRLKAVQRIAKLQKISNLSTTDLEDAILDDPLYLDFITAIETHFRLRLFAQLP